MRETFYTCSGLHPIAIPPSDLPEETTWILRCWKIFNLNGRAEDNEDAIDGVPSEIYPLPV